ncbi:MAG: helix-turn-helix transcriptional regulator [Candidatus Kapabacteria bacterium]|nr:helix-turn-helix transcriptional regulator [Candidatus Kapabacteria bacterium]
MSKTKFDLLIVDIVRQKRLESGYSQEQLAHFLGVSNGFIGKVESNKFSSKYNLNHINKLANIFNCSPKDFLPNYSTYEVENPNYKEISRS